jgi:hypothetical protein
MEDKDISGFRSFVVERTIVIEQLISVAITDKYFGSFKEDFYLEVLCDENFNSGLKLRILVKAFPDQIDSKTNEKIRRLFNIRNLFAHNHALKIFNGKEWIIINPKSYDQGIEKAKEKISSTKGLDFKELFDEFLGLLKEIEPLLNKLTSKYQK